MKTKLGILLALVLTAFGADPKIGSRSVVPTPSGNGWPHITAGQTDGAARAVNLSGADVTGTLPAANGGTGGASAASSIDLLNQASEASVASAATVDLGAQTSQQVLVTGNTGPITSFGTIGAGTKRWVRFASTPTLTHNATSLILPGGANINVAAGDTLIAVSEGGGNWRVRVYTKADGTALVGAAGGGDFSSNTSTSVDGEVMQFSGTGGKTGKRATLNGYGKFSSGVPTGVATIPVADGGTASTTAAAAIDLLNQASEASVTAASTTDLGAQTSQQVLINGTTAITSFGTVSAGTKRWIRFSGVLTLTHNATSLIIPGGANITTAAGDTAHVISEGAGNWRVRWYSKTDGTALVSGGLSSIANNTALANTGGSTATPVATRIENLSAAEVSVASGSSVDLGAQTSRRVLITGTTTINSFGTVAAGIYRIVRFGGALTLTYNATSMILPGAVSITTIAGDMAVAESEGGGNWRLSGYVRSDGTPLVLGSTATGTGALVLGDGGSHTLRQTAQTMSTDINVIWPAAPLTGYLKSTLSVTTNSTLTYVATIPLTEGGTGATTANGAQDALITAEASVASATTTDLGAQTSQNLQITGTTTITGFGTATAGIRRWGRFAAALTLTHNGTSLILPGGANITTAANDRFFAVSLGSGNWLVSYYQKADGTPLIYGTVPIANGGTGSTTANGALDTLITAEATVASATTTDLGAVTSQNVQVTGTTTITGFGTVASGVRRWGRFAGALTLTHNATSLLLPGGANITTAANDRFLALSLGSGNWIVVNYTKADGTSIVGGGGGLGYMMILCTTVNNNLAQNTTYMIGAFPGSGTDTFANTKVEVPKAGTIKRFWVKVRVNGTSSSAGTYTHKITKDGTTGLGSATCSYTATFQDCVDTTISQAVSAGDYISLQIITPVTLTTAPTNVTWQCHVYIE